MRITKKLLIIDDHQLFADGLKLILNGLPKRQVGGELLITTSADAQKSLSNREELIKNDLVLIDLHMPNFNGFSFLMALASQKIPLTVAVISGGESQTEIERAIRLGAQGYIPKNSDSSEMVSAVLKLLERRALFTREQAG